MKNINTIPEYLKTITDLSVQNFEMLDGLYRSMTTTKDFVEINYNKQLYRLPSFINMFAKVSTLENNFQSLVEIDGIGGAGVFVNGNNRKIKVCPFECKPVSIYFDKKDKIYSIVSNNDIDAINISEKLGYKLQIALENVNVKAHKYRIELYDFTSSAPVATYDVYRKYNTKSISFNATKDEIEEGVTQYISIKDIKYSVDVTNSLIEQYEFTWTNRLFQQDGTLPPNIFSIKYDSTSKYAASLSTGMILTTADRMASFVINSISDSQMKISSLNGAYALNESDKLYIKNDISEPHVEFILPNLKIKSYKIAAYADESNALGQFSDEIMLFDYDGDNITKSNPTEWVGDDELFKKYTQSVLSIKSSKMNEYINELYDMYNNNDINTDDAVDLINALKEKEVSAEFYNFDFSSNSEIDNIKNNLTSISNKIFVLEQKTTPTLLEAEDLKQLKAQRVVLTEKLSEASINSSIYSTNYKDGILKFTFHGIEENVPKPFVCYEVRYKIRNYNNSSSDYFYYNTISRDIIKGEDGTWKNNDETKSNILDVIVPKNAYIDYQWRIKYWNKYPNAFSWTEWSNVETVINEVSTNIDVSAITADVINTLKSTGLFSHIDGTTANTHSSEQISTQFLMMGGQTKPLDMVLNEIMKTFSSLQQSIFLRTIDDTSKGAACILYYDESKNKGYCYEFNNKIPNVNDTASQYTTYLYNPSERAVSVDAKFVGGDAGTSIVIQPNERVKCVIQPDSGEITLKDILKYPLLLPLDTIVLKNI